MRFEVLPGLPPYGPRALNFSSRGDQEYREGLVVRFFPGNTEPWVGNFIGDATECTVVLEHPNKSDVIVVARGKLVIVDPDRRTIHDTVAESITQVIPIAPLELIVFQGQVSFFGLKADNSIWRSPRISWDGFRNIEVRGRELRGEAFTPIQNAWRRFTLDLLAGNCSDGIYETER